MDAASKSDPTWQREVERCRQEIEEAERQLKGGHPDVAGLCLALSDWSAELRMILEEERRRVEHPAAEGWEVRRVYLRGP